MQTDGDFSIQRSQGVAMISQDNWQNPKAIWDNQWHLDSPTLGDK